MSSYRPGRDSWRAPPGPAGVTDSYRPPPSAPRGSLRSHGPPPPPPPSDMYYFKGNDGSANSDRPGIRRDQRSRPYRQQNDRRGFRSRPPVRASERPLLNLQHDEAEKSMLSNPDANARFRNIDELTDSEEEDMAQSEEDQEPAKRIRLGSPEATDSHTENAAVQLPKWSNPDPYTSLPPLTFNDSTAGKRIDVVKLIRKARLESGRKPDNDAQRDTDFISFDAGDPEDAHAKADAFLASTRDLAGLSTSTTAQVSVLGKRKRGGERVVGSDAPILPKWATADGTDSTPWLQVTSHLDSPAIALHKEIIDFYEWVRPQDYEAAVRAEVFQRLSSDLNRFRQGELRAFGSYAAGLYLPTGDMDLVFMRRGFRPKVVQGMPEKPSMLLLTDFRRFLTQQRICDRAQVIPAKVPIIKFIDKASGLRVDLSFDNPTGVVAIDTFERWKKEFPAMPILVSVIKQFLMIRGLNDVATDGLGGFSTICLVTSFLQHLPGLRKHANLGELLLEFFNYYGNIFDRRNVAIRLEPPAYVDKDNYRKYLLKPNEDAERLTIIDPNQPANNISGGSRKVGLIFESFARAHSTLQERLAHHETLRDGLQRESFLKDLIGGDFRAYEEQREILRQLHIKLLGPVLSISHTAPRTSQLLNSSQSEVTQVRPPNGTGSQSGKQSGKETDAPAAQNVTQKSSLDASKVAPSRSTNQTENESPVSTGNKLTKSQKLAVRFKLHRPDLKSLVGDQLSRDQAVNLGGYDSFEQMQAEFAVKDVAVNNSKKKKK